MFEANTGSHFNWGLSTAVNRQQREWYRQDDGDFKEVNFKWIVFLPYYQSAAIILCEFLYWINLANKLTLFLTNPGNGADNSSSSPDESFSLRHPRRQP